MQQAGKLDGLRKGDDAIRSAHKPTSHSSALMEPNVSAPRAAWTPGICINAITMKMPKRLIARKVSSGIRTACFITCEPSSGGTGMRLKKNRNMLTEISMNAEETRSEERRVG